MSKEKVIQTNFTGGELSPLMLGRVDTAKYQNGAKQLSNMLVKPQGAAVFRTGSQFVGRTKSQYKAVRLYDFEFSDNQVYILEIGDLYIRIWYNNGFVETAPGSGVPLEIVTPFTQYELDSLSFAQSADILFIAHPNYPPKKLKRLGANSWSLVDLNPLDGPYMPQAVDATLSLSNVTSVADATADSAIFTVPTTKVVTAITTSSHKLRLTVVAHGKATGDKTNVYGLKFTSGIVSINVAYPYGNGTYTVTKISNDIIELNESTNYSATTGAYDITSTSIQALPARNYLEYRKDNSWHLAKIIYIVSTTVAKVEVITNIMPDPAKSGAILTQSAFTVVSDKSGTFNADNIGYWVRAKDTNWYWITGLTDDNTITWAAFTPPMVIDYPNVTLIVTDPVTAGLITSNVDLFVTTDVGRLMRLNIVGKQPWLKILTLLTTASNNVVSNNRVVYVQLYGVIPAEAIYSSINKIFATTDVWRFGAWSDTSGYPRAVGFHEQRLWFAATVSQPTTIYGSQSSDFENFAPTQYDSSVTDNCAITYTIASQKANPIVWLMSGSALMIGTISNEFIAKPGNAGGTAVLTPANFAIVPQSNNGSLPGIRPVKAGTSVMFLQKAGRKLIEFKYDFNQDVFTGINLCVASDHILRQGGSAIALAYQREPNNIIWVLLADGSLAALTYEPTQQVLAWHRHSLARGGLVEAICCSKSVEGTEDVLYMVVKRTINGDVFRHIEYFSPDFLSNTGLTTINSLNLRFLDCSFDLVKAPGTLGPVITFTGLTNFLNESLSVLYEGRYIGDFVVNNTGSISINIGGQNNNTKHFYLGYRYTGTVVLLPLDNSRAGTAVGKSKRVGRTLLRLYGSCPFKYGSSVNSLDKCTPKAGDGFTALTDFFTGDIVVNLSQSYELTATPTIVQDLPQPLVILAVAPDLEIST